MHPTGSKVTAAEAKIAGLERALEMSRTISMAVGIAMHTFGLGRDEAIGYLRRLSQDNNIKLSILADQIVEAVEAGVQRP